MTWASQFRNRFQRCVLPLSRICNAQPWIVAKTVGIRYFDEGIYEYRPPSLEGGSSVDWQSEQGRVERIEGGLIEVRYSDAASENEKEENTRCPDRGKPSQFSSEGSHLGIL